MDYIDSGALVQCEHLVGQIQEESGGGGSDTRWPVRLTIWGGSSSGGLMDTACSYTYLSTIHCLEVLVVRVHGLLMHRLAPTTALPLLCHYRRVGEPYASVYHRILYYLDKGLELH